MKVSQRLSLHYILALAEKQKLGPQKVSHCHHSGLFEPWKSAKDCEMGGMWNPGVLAWIIKEEMVNGKPWGRLLGFCSASLDVCPKECHWTALLLGFLRWSTGIRIWLPQELMWGLSEITLRKCHPSLLISSPKHCSLGLLFLLWSELRIICLQILFKNPQNSFLTQTLGCDSTLGGGSLVERRDSTQTLPSLQWRCQDA